jgi:hypothetical protein
VHLVGKLISPDPPSYLDQIREIEDQMTHGNRRVTALRAVRFHGPGQPSFLITYRHRSLDAERDPSPSDGLRIYDPGSSGYLKLALDLRVPRTDGQQGRLVQLIDVGDYAKSGFPEAIATVSDLGPGGAVYPRPVLVRERTAARSPVYTDQGSSCETGSAGFRRISFPQAIRCSSE